MKNSTKKKLLGKRFYSAYRKIRFLRYKKRLLRQKAKSKQTESERTTRTSGKSVKSSLSFRFYRILRLSRYALKKWKIRRKENKAKLIEIRQAKKTEHSEVRQRIREKVIQDRLLDLERDKAEKNLRNEEKRLRKIDRKENRKASREAILYELTHFNRQSLRGWFKGILEFAENKDKRHSFFVISVNSLVLFLLSYLVIYITSQLITLWVASSFGYKTVFYYYKIYYDIESYDWSADSVKILFSIMPLTGVLMGTIFLILFSIFRNEPGNLKLFMLWGFVHGMVMFFGSLLMGTLMNKDFGWVIAYLYYRDTGKMIFSIISIFALVIIGGLIAKSFLISGNAYYNFLNKKSSKFLLSGQVIFPTVTGSIILALIKIPDRFYYGTTDEMYYEFFKLLTLSILIIPLVISFKTYDDIYFDEEPRRIKLQWKSVILTIVIILAFRFGLVSGITFGG
jgi:hypothetical protein